MPMKEKKKRSRKLLVVAILGGLALIVTIGMTVFSAHMDLYLGRGKAIVRQATGTENWEKIYYQKDYESKEALQQAANKLVEQIEAEGIVLLKNNGTLPLKGPNNRPLRVTLLGRSAADPVYGGSGSGSVDLSSVVDLRTALKDRGFEINETVYSELAEFASYTTRISNTGATIRVYKNPRANIVMDRPGSSTYYIGEMPVNKYSSRAIASFKDYSDAAIVVIGRGGGEGGDLSQDIKGFDDNYVKGQHQLQLNKDERDLLELATRNFEKVIVLINSSSAMELGIVEKNPGVDSILWIGSPGQTGFYAVADILKGSVTPSGKTADIYPADFRKDPTFVNFGNFKYRNIHRGNAIGDGFFVHYEEGIYYGYRYYETAAKEGFINYDEAVVYPFGFGLSYTTFAWELVSQELGPADGRITLSVRVTNTGNYPGKDVVQLYYSPPYYKGGIEKAAVILADFAKTKLLKPGESDVVTLGVAIEDMASYDYKKDRAYVLEKGPYILTLQTDSHHVKEGIPEIVYTVDRSIVYSGSNHRHSDKTVVTNQFDDVSSLFVDEPKAGYILNMSRRDFAKTFPTAPVAEDYIANDMVLAGFQPWKASEHGDPRLKMPKTGAQNGVSLIDLRGKDFTDPLWDVFLDQINPEDIASIVVNSAYATEAIPSLGKPATVDLDGPAGISAFMGNIHGTAYPSEVVIASTFNTELAREMGRMVGNEALELGVNGWYAPAVNIHRSPFAGRNFEYYSEDPYLSGKLATAVVSGAADKGVYAFLKHYVLNDQETNRNNNGLATWANEQAIREIYLKPFEMVVKNAKTTIRYIADDKGTMKEKEISAATALMSSFNRIGAVWTGGSVPLMQRVLREEWGFTGVVISDFNLYPHMFVNQGLMAGTDYNITFASMKSMEDATSPTAVNYLRRTAHRLMYTIAHSNAMNGLVPGTSVRYTMAPWRIGLIVFDVFVAIIIAILLVLHFKGLKKQGRGQ